MYPIRFMNLKLQTLRIFLLASLVLSFGSVHLVNANSVIGPRLLITENGVVIHNNPSRMSGFISIGATVQGAASLSQTFQMTNVGDDNLIISNVQNLLQDDYDKIQVIIGTGQPGGLNFVPFPIILQPGASQALTLRLQTTVNSFHLGYIAITSNDPTSGTSATPMPPVASISQLSGGDMFVQFIGQSMGKYQVQTSDSLVSSSWQNIGPVLTADQSGAFSYEDTDSVNHVQRFYRAAVNSIPLHAMTFNAAGAIGTPPGLVCPGDSNNSVPAGFSCGGQANGTICGSSAVGKTKVCNTGQCILLGDLNGDGDVNFSDTDAFISAVKISKTNLAANFTCDNQWTNTLADMQGFANILASQSTAEYNSRVRILCSDPTSLAQTQGRALVFINGPMDMNTYQYRDPVLVCVDNLGSYDANGNYSSSNNGYLSGKYFQTGVLSINNPQQGF
ncbi:MAG: hypothetical protein JWQ35_190, partial [Bacteriovoracaceae bacterium]|nr:hypothetical protein [Bacteriovoracaceae bacterium]